MTALMELSVALDSKHPSRLYEVDIVPDGEVLIDDSYNIQKDLLVESMGAETSRAVWFLRAIEEGLDELSRTFISRSDFACKRYVSLDMIQKAYDASFGKEFPRGADRALKAAVEKNLHAMMSNVQLALDIITGDADEESSFETIHFLSDDDFKFSRIDDVSRYAYVAYSNLDEAYRQAMAVGLEVPERKKMVQFMREKTAQALEVQTLVSRSFHLYENARIGTDPRSGYPGNDTSRYLETLKSSRLASFWILVESTAEAQARAVCPRIVIHSKAMANIESATKQWLEREL